MVRKISMLMCAIVLIIATAMPVHGATHSVYDGTISTTYVTYFKDIISGIGFNENYVAFRSGQYSYTLVVGDLTFENGVISSTDPCTEYVYTNESQSYNSTYRYYVNEINSFSLNAENYIIYSDVGQFPQLVERGAKYEILSAVLICICLVSIVINRIFYPRKR